MTSMCVFNRRKGMNGCSALTRKQCEFAGADECECSFFKNKEDYELTVEGYVERKDGRLWGCQY